MAAGALRSAWRHWRRLLGQAPPPPDTGLVPARAVQVLSAAEPDPTTVAAGRRLSPATAATEEWSFRETVVLRKSRRASSLIVWGTVGFTGALLLWAVLAPLPESIAVQGKLEPGSGVKEVKAPVPGVVETVLVKEGELVRRGQPLVRFDLRDARSKLAAAEAVRSRLQRENQVFQASFGEVGAAGLSANQRQRLASQLVDTASRQESARQELARSRARAAGLATSLATADSIASRYEQLASSGAVSDVQVLEARSRANDLRADLEAERRDSDRLRANLITASSSVGVDLRSRIETNLKEIAALDGEIRQARLQLSYSQLTAPSDGLVFDLDVSPGTVVQAQLAQALLKIVPQEALQA
ncbi:MAG: biotin/lipoyl-binding protein, partial [Prochlorococcaceae cyanobacterium]